MRLWRIADARYKKFDGEGARRWGGRWNSPGRAVVYTSMTASLAILEKLAWVDPDDLPEGLELFELEVSDDLEPARLDLARLPADWREMGCPACSHVGDDWLDSGSSLALVVPSALLSEEMNVLINPRHRHARRVRVSRSRHFSFDLRLFH